MSDSTAWKVRFLFLSALNVCYLFTGCNPDLDTRVSIPKSTFDRMIGGQAAQPLDTNFISRMEFVAARLAKEELQNSNNWASMRTILVQIEQKFAGLEKQVGGISTSMVQTNHPVIPSPQSPLLSAPAIEK